MFVHIAIFLLYKLRLAARFSSLQSQAVGQGVILQIRLRTRAFLAGSSR